LILFETADLRIAISHQYGELTLGEFFTFTQVFQQLAKRGEFFGGDRSFAQALSL
jgi:hypothetical protein